MTKSEILNREELEKFMKKSKVDIFAQRGLGKVTTAVDGFVELFSALLYKAGIDVGGLELERWLDCYYQLRYEAEREADLAKFVAEQIKSADKLEPVVPNVKIRKCSEPTEYEKAMSKFFEVVTLLAFVGGLRPFCGAEVKDPDEKEAAAENKDDGKDEFSKLTPFGNATVAKAVEKMLAYELERGTDK